MVFIDVTDGGYLETTSRIQSEKKMKASKSERHERKHC